MPVALIVDDEATTAELLAEFLRLKGYSSTILNEGGSVVRWVQRNKPDLILLDLMLPDVDGFTICEQLKLDRETNLIPIIMVTALDERQHRVRGFQVGANRYLTKPFTAEQLFQAVNDVHAWREDLLNRGSTGEIHFHLQSDTCYLDELNKLLATLFLHSGLSEKQVKQLVTAVRELGANAIEWGHRKEVERLVTITYRIDKDKVTIVIKDTGPGFDPKCCPHAAKSEDPLSHLEVRQELGLREGGFGILIANGLVDELKYNEKGNEVRLVKYVQPRQAIKEN
ncbi:MAG: hypothetical protein KatS3mg105_1710 [Gemmatales bacterium]|nr:MAG: hypothetical protein KatS3mg105_1710 [Gemmatales bacterium]